MPEEEDVDEVGYDSDTETGGAGSLSPTETTAAAAAAGCATSEPMQVDVSPEHVIRVGSPDDCSNNLDTDCHLLAVSQTPGVLTENHHRGGLPTAGKVQRWAPLNDPMSSSFQPPHSST